MNPNDYINHMNKNIGNDTMQQPTPEYNQFNIKNKPKIPMSYYFSEGSNSVNNMNPNFMMENQQNENFNLVGNFNRMNLKNDQPQVKKDMAYNYYFGASGQDDSVNQVKEENLYQKEPFFQENNFNQNMNYNVMNMNAPYMQLNMNNNYNYNQMNYFPPQNDQYANKININKMNNTNFMNNKPNMNAPNLYRQKNKQVIKNNQNPPENKFQTMNVNNSSLDEVGRYFVIKSLDEDNIHKVNYLLKISPLNIKFGAVQSKATKNFKKLLKKLMANIQFIYYLGIFNNLINQCERKWQIFRYFSNDL